VRFFEILAYAGGEWDDSKYKTFIPDKDSIISSNVFSPYATLMNLPTISSSKYSSQIGKAKKRWYKYQLFYP